MNPVKFALKALRVLLIPKYRFPALAARGFFSSMSDKEFISTQFKYAFGRNINLDDPETFSEKLHWLNLYNRQPLYADFADKCKAKHIAVSIIGEKYIIPSFGVWNNFDEIDFDSLPERFILKCNHDSGGYVICKDKKTFDFRAARKKINKHLGRSHYKALREWVYKNIAPKVFAEEYLENETGKGLHDYKVWCFSGRAEYIQYISGRQEEETYGGFYNREWILQDFEFDHPIIKQPVSRPERLEELISCAEKLSSGIPFVRADFYILEDGSIKFGEMTFFPMAGFAAWRTAKMDAELGAMIRLEGIKKTSGE